MVVWLAQRVYTRCDHAMIKCRLYFHVELYSDEVNVIRTTVPITTIDTSRLIKTTEVLEKEHSTRWFI